MFYSIFQLTIGTLPLLALGLTSCAKEETLASIGRSLSGPIDVAVDTDGSYFYVLNSDFDRSYKTGSISVLNTDGDIEASIEIPRLARALTIEGTDMLVLFDKGDDDEPHQIQLYDLGADPTDPELVKSWSSDDSELDLDCTPLNAVMRSNYDYFAVSCRGGKMYLGTLKSPRSKSELRLVREYSSSRRALYLDSSRELLLSFVTDVGGQTFTDLILTDEKSYSTKGKERSGANQIPDEWENSRSRRLGSTDQRQRYQFTVYDIAAEREKDFPLRRFIDRDDSTVANEYRWLYFTLTNFDGTPDTDVGSVDLGSKNYRVNFWEAKPSPIDNDVFYLSHRGRNEKASKFANNILEVQIIGDLRATEPVLDTSDVLNFNRIYGFNGELDPSRHYPSDFDIVRIKGRSTLVVNHFKDPIAFRKDAQSSIAAKLLDGSFWRSEISASDDINSFHQVAVNTDGKALTCSFYDNSLIPLQINPGEEIELGWGDREKID